MDFLRTVQAEWPVISHAPWSASALVVFAAAITWGVATWFHNGRISTLKERLQLRDDQIALLKETLQNPNAEAAVLQAKAELAKQEAPQERRRTPFSTSAISLVEAIRYLAEDAAWTNTLDPEAQRVIDKIVFELKDKLERGTIHARGVRTSRGVMTHQRGPEDIPRSFWPGAVIDVYGALSNRAAASTAHDDRDQWDDIQLDELAVKTTWAPLSAGERPHNRYIAAMRTYRTTGVAT